MPTTRPVRYPDSDGRPIADNTEQFEWIVVLKDNLDAMLPDFVAGDLLWYPVEGDNKTRVAPDVLVTLGRPSGTARGAGSPTWDDGTCPTVCHASRADSPTPYFAGSGPGTPPAMLHDVPVLGQTQTKEHPMKTRTHVKAGVGEAEQA